ncbi:glycosyltransferase family 2 protein [Herbaspirillum seropedicae]|uniref:glycosyltransferase family 2 protein n=1 Tax=Herbaspirillum seropedicae TaxID=964 RepID=UPI0008482364|nr:hypothetical protein [Herbaspirillum seropedicae]AON52603.1 hypothetical protein Hsc_0290 [Herbaspirillum seropedicae]MDR6395707.1 hypothetical protein [Herbaspirillum seropedicae]
MSQELISLILPTRGRPALVERFFASLRATTACLDQLEVILYVDEDDIGSHHLGSLDFHVTRIIGPAISMGGYNSACLERARGEILILVNDDIVVRSQGWDLRVRGMHAEFDDQIYLGYANDLFKKSKFCTFPILSRRTCELLIDPYPPVYQRFFLDVHLFDIFKRLQHAGVDRVRYDEDLVFEHLHYRTGKAPFDKTYGYARMGRFADDATYIELSTARSAAAQRLLAAVRKRPGVPRPVPAAKRRIPDKLPAAIAFFSRQFLSDSELPLGWRAFLWYWFIGRYLAARGYLRLFLRRPTRPLEER